MLSLFPILATEGGTTGPAGPSPDAVSGYTSVGWVIAIILIVGFGVAVVANMRRGKAEVGAEIELAPNRKPYYSDEELEGPKLDRTLSYGLVLLAIVGVTLPLYWLYEPARQEGAIEQFEESAIERGEKIYTEKAQCANCHGPEGGGGAASYVLLSDNGDYIGEVSWQAPALDTVLYRYSEEEVLYILEYGRPNSPMPAWGAKGGGPLTEQQLTNTVAFLRSIQLPESEYNAMLEEEIAKVCKPDADNRCTVPDPDAQTPPQTRPDGTTYTYDTLGEALFNLGLNTKFQGGAVSCGRCHTKGWSYGRPEVPGGGFLGWNLTGGSTIRQFPTSDAMVQFVARGSELGKPYGKGGMGSGQMPGFGYNPNVSDDNPNSMSPGQVMLSIEQIAAVVEYERSL